MAIIDTVKDVTDKHELDPYRAIIFTVTLNNGETRRVTQQCQRGTSYAQYESNMLHGLLKAGYDITDLKWKFIAAN